MKTTNLKRWTLLVILVLSVITVFSQGRKHKMTQEDREKIESRKIGFITDKLDLTPEEAQKFWPIYNTNREKMNAERKQFKGNYKLDDETEFSDEQAKDFLDAFMKHEQKMLDLQKAYFENLNSALSPQKIVKLVEVEKKFREELIREVSRRHKSQQQQR